MRHPVSHIHCSIDTSRPWIKHPRVWYLVVGLLMASGAGMILLSTTMESWFLNIMTRSEIALVLFILVLGVGLVIHAARSDVFRVHWVQFTHRGFRLNWSHAEHLTSPRTMFDSDISWDQVKSLEWVEGRHDHSEDQFLLIELHQSLGRGHPRIKVRVSDARNHDQCERLLAVLPPSVCLPIWINKAREIRNH